MTDLDEKLKQAQKQAQKQAAQKWDNQSKKDDKKPSWDDGDFSELEKEIWAMDQVEKIQKEVEKLQKDLQEQTEIATRAQRDYVNLKLDFDRYQRQTAEKEQDLELMSLLSSVKKFLPFVEDLRKSLDNIPEEKKSDPLAHGVQLVYNNFLKTLEWINVYQIEAIGLVPDANLHEPVSAVPATDEKQKWKIVQEFERGFVYRKSDKQIVLKTSKVIVAQ